MCMDSSGPGPWCSLLSPGLCWWSSPVCDSCPAGPSRWGLVLLLPPAEVLRALSGLKNDATLCHGFSHLPSKTMGVFELGTVFPISVSLRVLGKNRVLSLEVPAPCLSSF